jgi:uncharacterized protein YjbJ (UPF0337 family)
MSRLPLKTQKTLSRVTSTDRRQNVNTNILEGKWKQIRGEAKIQWGRLTDGELDQVAGSRDKLIGLIQEKYGYAQQEAERVVDRFLSRFN